MGEMRDQNEMECLTKSKARQKSAPRSTCMGGKERDNHWMPKGCKGNERDCEGTVEEVETKSADLSSRPGSTQAGKFMTHLHNH